MQKSEIEPDGVDPEKAHLYSPERWRNEALDIPLWHRRTAHMAALLRQYLARHDELDRPLQLLEFGCAAMALESILETSGLENVRYIPSDCHARDDRTLVLDLNAADFIASVPRVDVVFLGGVLEYLDDLEGVLTSLATRTRYLFFSYCPRTASQTRADRLGWKNHLTEAEMRAFVETLGDSIEAEGAFDPTASKPVSTFFARIF